MPSRPAALLLATSLAACSRPPPVPGAPPPTVALRDVRVVRMDGSEVALTGHLASLSFRRNEGQYAGEEGHFHVPAARGGNGAYDVDAAHVQGVPADERAEGSGGVTLRTERGVTGRTASALLDGKARAVTGTERLEARGQGFRMGADRFRLSLDGATHRFEGHVDTHLEADE